MGQNLKKEKKILTTREDKGSLLKEFRKVMSQKMSKHNFSGSNIFKRFSTFLQFVQFFVLSESCPRLGLTFTTRLEKFDPKVTPLEIRILLLFHYYFIFYNQGLKIVEL